MLRSIQISVSPDRTEPLLRELRAQNGLLSLSVQRGVGVTPPGDIITAQVTSTAFHPFLRLLQDRGITTDPGCRIVTSDLSSAASLPDVRRIARGSSDLSWEEMEVTLGKESNMTRNALIVMFISGAFAAVGLHTNALHYVIAAMLVAPGFEPVVRIAHGIVGASPSWRRGVQDVLTGYLALVAGAALTGLALKLAGNTMLGAQAAYHAPHQLIGFWSAISPSGLVVDFLAGIAGTLLIATGRSILTGGVMIALALVPAAAFIGLGLAYADGQLVRLGALRWSADVVLVLLGALLVFGWKRIEVQRRSSWL